MAAGGWLVWTDLERVSASLRVGAVCLFAAGSITYLELRSLLSRGYSLRILLDLMDQEQGKTVERLRSEYGNGMGMTGLLLRRVQTLARLRLVHVDGHRVGPLTPLGKAMATTGFALRQVVRMEEVG